MQESRICRTIIQDDCRSKIVDPKPPQDHLLRDLIAPSLPIWVDQAQLVANYHEFLFCCCGGVTFFVTVRAIVTAHYIVITAIFLLSFRDSEALVSDRRRTSPKAGRPEVARGRVRGAGDRRNDGGIDGRRRLTEQSPMATARPN